MAGLIASIDPTKTIDHYDRDDGDATHPIGIPYIVPSQVGGIIRVTLSWHREAFRSTADLNPSSIGSTTPSVDATGSSGHDHSHGHSLHITPTLDTTDFLTAQGSGYAVGQVNAGTAFDTSQVANADATAESGHDHSHDHGSHSHSLSGSGVQSVTDGPEATITALSIDGTDYTATLGGPWAGDIVEMDISAIFQKSAGAWHTILLSLSGLGRITSLLRIYYTS